MNDRFKFRVWDKSLKKYMEFKEFKFMNVEFTFNPITKEAEIEYDKERYDVEQCTGKRDKNGKLIYEGDILKTLDGRICWVIWMGTSFWLKSPGSEAKDWEYDSFYEHCEVIGNIHENRELLEESK